MGANGVVNLRFDQRAARVVHPGPRSFPEFPDPRPSVIADISAAIDRSRLALEEIAAILNRTLGTTHICAGMVGSWYRGETIPPTHYARVLFWIGGMAVTASVTQALPGS